MYLITDQDEASVLTVWRKSELYLITDPDQDSVKYVERKKYRNSGIFAIVNNSQLKETVKIKHSKI